MCEYSSCASEGAERFERLEFQSCFPGERSNSSSVSSEYAMDVDVALSAAAWAFKAVLASFIGDRCVIRRISSGRAT